jgi:hypothetical protein
MEARHRHEEARGALDTGGVPLARQHLCTAARAVFGQPLAHWVLQRALQGSGAHLCGVLRRGMARGSGSIGGPARQRVHGRAKGVLRTLVRAVLRLGMLTEVVCKRM